MITLTPTTDTVRIYECAVLVPASLSDKEYSATLKNIEELFVEKGAKLLHKDDWGRMGLAYRIKGNAEGRYVIYYYEIAPGHIREISRGVQLEKGVLRHMLITMPDRYEVQDWAAHFASWKDEKKSRAAKQVEKKEEELKKKIVQRAARKTVEPPVAPAEKKEGEVVERKELEKKIGELISDEDLQNL
jgi:small subunit ribosomal protein S6